MNYYPAFLNLKGKNVLLFGGGEVALRKAKRLIEAEAKVTAVSKVFSGAFRRFAASKRIRLKKGSEIPKRLDRFALVVAATSDAGFNRLVYRACQNFGIWVNVVDDPEHSSFIVPSVLRRGSLQVAVSTGGASPMLARLVRQKLEKEITSKYADLARFLKHERPKAKKLIGSLKKRRDFFYRLVKSKMK